MAQGVEEGAGPRARESGGAAEAGGAIGACVVDPVVAPAVVRHDDYRRHARTKAPRRLGRCTAWPRPSQGVFNDLGVSGAHASDCPLDRSRHPLG